ncbi:MAG: recombination mediator RecR [Spirochaetes bacterium]|jgi:recombination protein RecR|nr:recombination mediator RecR [Spirochaetota bacterium]
MNGKYSSYLDNLIKKLSSLPGIGPKSASRLAFHILKMHPDEVTGLSRAITDLKENIRTCGVCGGISEGEVCGICVDPSRDRSMVCVVEDARDILIIESTGGFKGLYHSLNGLLSPLDGIGPEDLSITGLVERCRSGGVSEIILALNPTMEGDATSLYLARVIAGTGVRVTRIAHGLPVGADLEFADGATIAKSIEGRVSM